MKLHFHCLFLIFSATVQATTVQEIKDLKESGFSEGQILELVIKEKNYEVSDLIDLKNLGFSPDFIIKLRNKALATTPKLESSAESEISAVTLKLEVSNKKLSDLEKCLSSVGRTFKILESKTYQSAGLWSDLGSLYKRNGYDQSLEAPARDSERFQRLLSESISGLSDDIGISQNDFFSLIDTWVELKKSAMEVDAISEAARSDAYKRSDNRPSSSISSQLHSEKLSLKRHEQTFESKKATIIEKIKSAITREEQKVEELKILNTNGPYEETIDGIKYKGTWKGSKDHGKRVSFFENGSKEGEDNWIEGIKVGKEIRWFLNGSKKYEVTRDSKGNKLGVEKSWHENGELKFQSSWTDGGLKDGEEKYFYDNGEIKLLTNWELGSLLNKKEFSIEGELTAEFKRENLYSIKSNQKVEGLEIFEEFNFNHLDQTASFSFFDENSEHTHSVNLLASEENCSAHPLHAGHFQLKSKSKTFFLIPHGEYVISNEGISYEGNFRDGVPVGVHIFSNDNNTESRINFAESVDSGELVGELNGTINGNVFEGTITFSEIPTYTGKVYAQDWPQVFFFENNEMLKIIIGDEHDPQKIVTRSNSPREFSVEDFYENGKPKGKINFKDGLLNGTCELFKPDGTKILEANFESGARNGTTRIYHSNGKLSCEINYEGGTIKDKVSAFYEDGQSYNPKSGFLSTKYSLKYSKDSVWRVGTFSKGIPSKKQSELNREGQEIQSFEYVKASTNDYGIFEMRFDPENKDYPSLKDYDNFAKTDFYRIKTSYRQDFRNLNSIFENLNFLKTIHRKLESLELDIEFVDNWAEKKFSSFEPPITSGPHRETLTYTVREGDTLFTIANKFNTTMALIRSENPYVAFDDGLKVGQQLRIVHSPFSSNID